MRVIQASLIILLLSTLTACGMNPKKVDPKESYTTDTGFNFKFPMSGEWRQGPAEKGRYMVGQKPDADGTTRVATVHHGPIAMPGGEVISNKEKIKRFRLAVEHEAKSGRVQDVKSTFTETKYQGADCLSFKQIGKDMTQRGPMAMYNDGIICLHPKHPSNFIWMAFSERRPEKEKPTPAYVADQKGFFESLNFTN